MLFTKLTFLDDFNKELEKPILAKSTQEALRLLQTRPKQWVQVRIEQVTEKGSSPLAPQFSAREKEAAQNLIKALPSTEAEYELKNGRVISAMERDKEQEAMARAYKLEEMQETATKKCWTPFFESMDSERGQERTSYDTVSLLGFVLSWTAARCLNCPEREPWYFPIIVTRKSFGALSNDENAKALWKSLGQEYISKHSALEKNSPLLLDILTAYALAQEGLCSAEDPDETETRSQRYGIDDAFVQSIQKELFAKYDRVRVQDLLDLLQKRSPASLANVLVRYEETKDAAEAAEAAHASKGSKKLIIPDDASAESDSNTVPPKAPVSLSSIGQWFTATTLSCPSVGTQKALTQTVPTNNLHLVSGDWQEITNQNEACKVETSLSPVKVLGTALGLGVMVAGLGLLIKK